MRDGVLKLKGANMDIDLTTVLKDILWKQEKCPWNKKENANIHKCTVKNISICDYFRGIEESDIVLCKYPEK